MSTPLLPLPLVAKQSLSANIAYFSDPLYTRTFSKEETLDQSGRWCWFSQERGYGSSTSYGAFIHKWNTSRELRLLNISSEKRGWLAALSGIKESSISCDEQYSGDEPNQQFHDEIFSIIRLHSLDGTYAQENPTSTSEKTCGVSEVVLLCDVVKSTLIHTGVAHDVGERSHK
jgi:hypothetical protein